MGRSGPTAESLSKELAIAVAKIDDLEKQVYTMEDALKQAQSDVNHKNARIGELEGVLKKAEEKYGTLYATPKKDLVEIVAIPVNKNVKVGKLKAAQGRESVDSGGFHHYHVPFSAAQRLLGISNGTTYRLLGPMPAIKTERLENDKLVHGHAYRYEPEMNEAGNAIERYIPASQEKE